MSTMHIDRTQGTRSGGADYLLRCSRADRISVVYQYRRGNRDLTKYRNSPSVC